MRRTLLTLITTVFILSCCHAGEITLSGNYYGNNLVVLNPSIGNGFCVTEVLVNGKKTSDEIRSNSFEIDFSLLELKSGDPVKVVIKYHDGCTPTIVNPQALTAHSAFTFVSIKFDRSGKLTWTIKGELGEDPFFVEQFRWNKWVQVTEVRPSDTIHNSTYAVDVNTHYGLNQFRIVKTDASGNPIYSKVAKYNNIKATEVELISSKITDKISFSAETMYELFDQNGNYLSGGIAKDVDASDLGKGKYFLNYDTKSVTVTKK
jgi:hypothetical protein